MADGHSRGEGTSTSDDIGWREAMTQLAHERTLAEGKQTSGMEVCFDATLFASGAYWGLIWGPP
jgi:hypothetical protein